ncbi:MAG: hypothetical protein HC884_06465 [Chloroflexaceae bacterium]|nr:hypothetical protein [Chloroflexaceae bacterium]
MILRPRPMAVLVLALSILLVGMLLAVEATLAYRDTTVVLSSSPSPSVPSSQTEPGLLPFFGAETNPGKITDSVILSRAQELGIGWVRLNSVSWRDVQPDEGTPPDAWNWDRLQTFEQELQAVEQAGLVPMVIADDFPDWATIHPGVPCAALETEYFDDYARFLGEVVTRYRGRVSYWELGNEVDVDPSLLDRDLQDLFGCWGDISDPYYGGRHYGEMLKFVAPVIRSANPDAHIITGGLLLDRASTNIPGRGTPEKFLEGVLEAGAAESFDIVAFHSYPWYDWQRGRLTDSDLTDYRWEALGGMTIGKARFLRDTMARYGADKPLVLNEASLLVWGSGTDDALQAQADHIVRVLARARSVNIQAYCWYTLHDSSWWLSGLLHSDRTPKPVYTAYQQFIAHIGATTAPAAVTEYGETIETYRFAGETETALEAGETAVVDVLWSEEPEPVTIELPTPWLLQATTRDGAALAPAAQTRTRTFLTVGVEPVYLVRTVPSSPLLPHPSEVAPPSGYNDQVISLVISGTNLLPGAAVFLEQPASQRSYQLAEVSPVVDTNGANQIQARISPDWRIPPGPYDLVVQNPDGAVGTLPSAFTVLAHPPSIYQVWPHQGRSDALNTIAVQGANFSDQASVTIGPVTIPVTHTYVLSRTDLLLLVPPALLPPGDHALTVTNPDTTQATLPNALRIYGEDDVDLFGYSHELWTDPVVPHTGLPAQMGLVVHHQGKTTIETETPVRVSFSLQGYDHPEQRMNPGVGEVEPPLAPGTTATAAISWTAEASGRYTLCASINPDQVVEEVDALLGMSNNEVCRDMVILPPASDQDAPVVNLSLNAEATSPITPVTTTETTVMLQVRTSPPQDGAWYLVQEYAYLPVMSQWVPVRHSDWLTATSPTNVSWTLWTAPGGDLPVAGKNYLQVWVADAAGNISRPATASVIYLPPGAGSDGEPYAYGSPELLTPPGEPDPHTMPPLLLPYLLSSGESPSHTVYLPLVVSAAEG